MIYYIIYIYGKKNNGSPKIFTSLSPEHVLYVTKRKLRLWEEFMLLLMS